VRDRNGVLRDVQLKGSGLTPYSRTADGRAAIGPMLREYLISEAMHALRIPTTRSLAVVTTGELVRREDALPGAVLARVAASHVRVGTFEYFAARRDVDGVRDLLNYVIARHYPNLRESEVPALALLKAVAERQAALISQWMLVAFIHGVMNTDNMTISGETIDYGPVAFMEQYNPRTVFSSIDHNGRYAYANQPAIAQWNLARLADTLIPLIDADTDKAVQLATEVIQSFMETFDARFLEGMRKKIGLASAEDGDTALIRGLLSLMQGAAADFTLTFRKLCASAETTDGDEAFRQLFSGAAGVDDWLRDWRARLARDPQAATERAANMRQVNPAYIPRNHRVEAALNAASERGDFEPFRRLLAVVQNPFEEQLGASEYELPAAPEERVFNTFCGT
jgi:serine/tyrosine/threonine adenylyltransferase